MEQEVQFVYGTWEQFQQIQNKDPGTLYFLDNNQVYKGNQLLSSTITVNSTSESTDINGFPLIPTAKHRNKYIISLIDGEIRFVDNDLEYTSISELFLDSILINQEFLQQLMAAIADTQEVIMPTLTVDNNTLVWTDSNVDSMTVFIPKQ